MMSTTGGFCTDDGANLSSCLFDDADDECFKDLSSPIIKDAPQTSQAAFGSFSMKYIGRKMQEHGEDMETEHSDRMVQLELTQVPDLTEYENSQSFDGYFFQQYSQQAQQGQGAQHIGEISKAASEIAQSLVSNDSKDTTDSARPRIIIAGQSHNSQIPPTNLPPEYQNSKILSSFYAQTENRKDGSGYSSMDSSPVRHEQRSVSLSPYSSPQPERKAIKSRVKNRDINVWAPGSLWY